MGWLFFNANACFEDFRADWDALNRARGNHILLDSRFVAPLIRHFGTKDTILAVNKEGPKQGLALLSKDAPAIWTTFQPSQSPLGMVLLGYQDDGYDGLVDLMRALPGYTLLLSILQQDPLYSSFSDISNRANIEILRYIDTPRLRLTGTFEEYWGQRGKNLKHNLDRQSRRIKEQGLTLELIAEQDSGRAADCIREYGRLEAAGWKGQEGTAIEQGNAQGRFYTDVLEDFFKSREAVVFQLCLEGKVIASDLCLSRDGMLVVLKTTYDEKTERLSPALLMRREIIRELFAGGQTRIIEFYGKVREWHVQWTTETRTMFHVNLFRNIHVITTRKILKRLQ